MPQHVTGLPEEMADRFTGLLTRFLKIEAAAGGALLLATLTALILTNSAWSAPFLAFWKTPVGLHFGRWAYSRPLQGWINDGLMTLFFFVVSLELKRELILGNCAICAWRRCLSPVRSAACSYPWAPILR